MAPKKEKVQTVPAEEAESRILDYMIGQNRPYSAMDIMQNLHNTISRTVVNRALVNLEARGVLVSKTFGKQVIYVSKQSITAAVENNDEEQTNDQEHTNIEELKKIDQESLRQIAILKKRMAELQVQPSTKSLIDQTKELSILVILHLREYFSQFEH
ncbi:Tat binding protein 1-interacting [Lipomyces japonicus]|uniref:Tat binding protein 1-interacting n=1 Tax=Lipomyces japonicus TaxID=56871 RepID=UPI0034CEAB71